MIQRLCNQGRKKRTFPQREDMLLTLHHLQMMTVGQADRLFCNTFISESIQLLINAVLLFEDGYFDCAFYSLRQSSELFNNMLYISNKGEDELKEWNKKSYFPMNKKVLEQLEKLDCFYVQVKESIPDFFEGYENKIKNINKIVHKQGLDNFYTLRDFCIRNKIHSEEQELNLFMDLFNDTLCMLVILYVITDPISLVLTDEKLSMRLHFAPMTEPASIGIVEKYLSPQIIDKIKSTDCFKELSDYLMEQEEMQPAVADVVRWEFIDLDSLDDINKQRHLLSLDAKLIIDILLRGINISTIYPNCIFPGYNTSIKLKYQANEWSSLEYSAFLNQGEQYNICYHNVYRSVFRGYADNWLLEHNNELTQEEIEEIKGIFSDYRMQNA